MFVPRNLGLGRVMAQQTCTACCLWCREELWVKKHDSTLGVCTAAHGGNKSASFLAEERVGSGMLSASLWQLVHWILSTWVILMALYRTPSKVPRDHTNGMCISMSSKSSISFLLHSHSIRITVVTVTIQHPSSLMWWCSGHQSGAVANSGGVLVGRCQQDFTWRPLCCSDVGQRYSRDSQYTKQ